MAGRTLLSSVCNTPWPGLDIRKGFRGASPPGMSPNLVGLEAVHALAGVMDYKRASKGVLVTTSWVGKASRDFAAANGRIQIIEGRNLKALLKEHLGLDVLIGLPNIPPGWTNHDLN
jgi:Restriction endonuclease